MTETYLILLRAGSALSGAVRRAVRALQAPPLVSDPLLVVLIPWPVEASLPVSALVFTWCSACVHVCLQISPLLRTLGTTDWATLLQDYPVLTNDTCDSVFLNKATF